MGNSHSFYFSGTELGTVLTIASANDVDTYPALAYSFDEVHTDEDALALFAIDRFSGKVLLKRPLDYEMRQEYQLKILASDTKYTAQSTLTIHIQDENDNAPEFTQLMYQTTISGKHFFFFNVDDNAVKIYSVIRGAIGK